MLNRSCFWSLLVLIQLTAGSAYAADGIFYKEVNLIGGHSDVNDWTGVFGNGQKNSIGFESYQKFANEYGDFLTSDLQVRLSYNDLADSDDEWSLDIHNAWLDFKLGLGKKVRVGHFDPHYGLEPEVDTHSSLFQTLAKMDVGFKKDWGLAYSGTARWWDYDLSTTMGSGMGIEQKDGSVLVAAKVSTPGKRNVRCCLSGLYGEVLESMEVRTIPRPEYSEHSETRKRIGIDSQLRSGPFDFAMEVTIGRNETNDVAGALLELVYNVQTVDNLLFRSQYRFWSEDSGAISDEFSRGGCGLEWRATNRAKLAVAYFYDLEAPSSVEDRQILLQFYYLGE
jgi:hypothetical protein